MLLFHNTKFNFQKECLQNQISCKLITKIYLILTCNFNTYKKPSWVFNM